MRACVFLVVLMGAGARVHVSVADAELTSLACANPISDVLLVHRVLISLVSAGPGHINASRLHGRLDSESKLRNLAN